MTQALPFDPAETLDPSRDAVAALVRAADFDRYAATLFAPAPARPHLLALYAFDAELARVRDLVSAPLPGEMRLQWWRDALDDPKRADAASHPVARRLEAAIAYGRLPRAALVDLVDARVEDLYDDPVADMSDLERRLGATSSAVLRLASLIAAAGRDPGGVDAAGHGGVAHGIVRLFAGFARQAARGQTLLPAELMARHGVALADVFAGRGTRGLTALLSELATLGRSHLDQARSAYGALDPSAAGAFLPLALVGGDLDRMERRSAAPFAPFREPAAWPRLFRLWRASGRTPPF